MDPGNENPSESPGVPVNLNDLQHYLVSFNKEIEQTDDPDQFTVGADTAGVVVGEALTDVQTESGFITIEAQKVEPIDSGNVENVVNVVDLKLPYGTTMDISEAVQQLSQVETTPDVGGQTQPIANGQPDEVSVDLEDPGIDQGVTNCISMAEVQAHMAELAAQGQVTKLTNVEELTKAVNNKQTECFMKQLEIPVSDSGDGEQKIVHVVSIDGQEHMQLVDAGATGLTTGLNTSTGQLIHIPAVSTTLTDSIEQELANTVGNGSDPVAVLASVAANTSTLNQLQTITVGQTELNSAQVVALQNSADSSQPQLVAVQAQEGAMEILGAEVENHSNSIVLNTGDNNFQTVTIVPSEMNPSGEMSYVLIVSQPDKDDGNSIGSPKQLSLDMSSMLDMKDETQEMVEEVVQEDGTTRRIITFVPKRMSMPVSNQAQLMCHYCDYTSPKRYLLMRHMKTHSEDRPHKCNICDRGFKTMASLQNHVNTHTGTRPHKCKGCGSAFTTSGELVRHIRYKHTFEKPHKCTECDYASVELSKMKRHMRSHTGERPYHCPHCNYASPDTYKLKRHLRIHTGEKPYECDVCHARFTQSNSLKAHKLIHSGNKPVFLCHLCPTTCGRKTDLKIHMSKLHSSAKPLTCKKCGSTCPDRYQYKLHMKSHEGEKCFKCEQCDYAAQSLRHLESHILTHTGEKPFDCKECGQTFRQKQLLRRHINLYHSPEYSPPETRDKMYECDECDKTFAHKGNLMRHMQQHDPDSLQYKDLAGQGRLRESLSSPLTAEQLLQGSLLTEMREGKLGNTPKIVIVHPDGRVEEVTSKLQSLAHEKDVEDVLMGMTEDRDQVEDGHPDSILQVTSGGNLDNQTIRMSLATATMPNPDSESVLQDLQQQTGDERKDVETQVALETDSEHEEEVEQIFQQSGANAEDGNADILQIDLHTAAQDQEAAENVVISLQTTMDTRSKKRRESSEDSTSPSKRIKIS
ncbi:transcriptional repressor CTCF-like [Mizuhopecten yessoensis]|uniref:CCCTC-binding factor n=1 Tax=Mizuhopecten yessoensis TaxID=6573 RepID=A0A210PZ83_MIZYE|nr:transcriptional repressor CTCF-like [Mizuhopecten yessoensis]XP_021371327.1 transcriptional repressor CTCF-like [Mizuhopecten yessoensis]OWF41806.1 Transcriptional repressor CTCF [Mizuhopecten yessoensis]